MSWSENINSYGIIGCVTLILWWPIWWAGKNLATMNIYYVPIWKGSFYINLFAMWISWVVLYQVLRRGLDLREDKIWIEVLKSMCFLGVMLLLMDLPLMISQF